jgi:deferrochelatase/peroxidase EfeB
VGAARGELVGRWRSGAPLTLAPDRDDPAVGADPQRRNDFTYAADPHGLRVPLGSHIGRMNPGDTEMTVLADVNIHRVARRRNIRGLYFIFLSATAMATMEFLQQEWINNGNFLNLGDERDPNVGLQERGATVTIPRVSVWRRIHGIEAFNVLRGGEYFFLPSLSALRWLGQER